MVKVRSNFLVKRKECNHRDPYLTQVAGNKEEKQGQNNFGNKQRKE